MGGIAGFAGLDDRSLLESMAERLRHRGLDGAEFFHQGGVGLGSRRPAAGESGCVLAFDGRLCGPKEPAASDEQTIVRLYERKGLDVLKELRGVFALALWDPRTKRLLLARDPLGAKPLYYASAGSTLYFGSELKALRRVPNLIGAPDLPSLEHLVDYLYIPAPKTVYAGVSKLKAGEWLLWQDGFVQRGLFWEPKPRRRDVSWSRALEELDALLLQAVREQRTSDAPVGLLLGGGLDSAVVAHYLAKDGAKNDAFFASFSPEGGLERARSAAKWFGLPLNESVVAPNVEEGLEALLEAFDEPMADPSALATLWIGRAAGPKVGAALTGLGGDELFGGAPRYLGAKLFDWYQWVPRELRSAAAEFAASVPEGLLGRGGKGWKRRFLVGGADTPERAYAAWMGQLSSADKDALYSRDLQTAAHMACAPFAAFELEGDLLQRVLAVDLKTYVPEDLLTQADRAGMAAGLELRAPFCDQRVVEFALGLPSYFRVRGWTLKAMLKTLMKGRLPEVVLKRKAPGARVPVGAWLRGERAPAVDEVLKELGRRGIFRPDGLARLFAEHRSGKRDRSEALWALVFVERWLRKYHPSFKI